MKIAVDAMGGDFAPAVVVNGALQAAEQYGIPVTLVGDGTTLEDIVGGKNPGGGVSIRHCDEVVRMDESPFKAIRSKKSSSIRIAFELVRDGQADAVVSAGNSGATLAAGLVILGRLKGVERPGIASILPGRVGDVILIDAGANVDCRPVHLLHFAFMANAFAVSCLGMKNPKVGLLSIGEEGVKGNELVKAAHGLFKESGLNFAGNVEGRDIFSGEVQVIVCDGFVGNVALKVSEGMAKAVSSMIKEEMRKSLLGKLGLIFGAHAFKRLRDSLDYETYGGAPILGINGIGIVCHGSSSERAILNGIRRAAEYLRNDVRDKLAASLGQGDSSGSREP